MTNPNTETLPSIEQRADDLLLLSGVVNKFIDVKRATLRDGRPETDGEHTLQLQFIAVAYAGRYHPELDVGKVALYALVHDFVEVYAGDVNSLSAPLEQLAQKALTEAVAIDCLQRELGEVWPEFMQQVEDYEFLRDPEARFVKCFDKCDPSFTHYENAGAALYQMAILDEPTFTSLGEEVCQRRDVYAAEFTDVIELRQELLERVARVSYSTV